MQVLDRKPADLTDPLFNSREPAEDWKIVVTHGGTALAPGSGRYPPGEFNFLPPSRIKKAFPDDEIVWKSRASNQTDGDNVWRNTLELEKRFGRRSMGVLEVLYEDDGTEGGDHPVSRLRAAAHRQDNIPVERV